MGIFTYIKIGLAVVVLSILGFYIANYHMMKTKILAQQTQINNLKLEQEVQAKKQKTFDDFMAKKTGVKRKVVREQQHIEETVNTGDDSQIIDLFDVYRFHPDGVRRDGKAKPAPDGSKRGSQSHP